MFPGFESIDVEVGGLRLHARVAGSGPAVLLLHGYPQTHAMWHQVAPILARDHTVVAADLRGYGDSAKPAAGADHAEYCKRSMAGDQVALMATLGFDAFAAVGHDRGGRVVHRMCLDHPNVVTRAAVLDIVPTRHVFATADQHLALAYYHWFFLAQPADLPERLIGGDPDYFLRWTIHQWSATDNPFGDVAVNEYVRCFRDPAAIAASCEDYRAAATIDLEHDDQSARAGHRVTCPLLVMWGLRSVVGRHYDVLSVWRSYANDVRARGIDCGHFLAEEQPEATSVTLGAFLDGDA